MPQIRPISDLRNNFADISKLAHEAQEPIFLTKNGYGDMVVMSIEAYDIMMNETEINLKLCEAQQEANQTTLRYSSDEVFDDLRKSLQNKVDTNDV